VRAVLVQAHAPLQTHAPVQGPAPPPLWCALHYNSFAFDLYTLEDAHVSATHSSSVNRGACSGAYGERLQCGVWRWQSAYPLRATMSFRRSVGVTTTLANCRAKPLFSADAAMRPMTAAVPDRGYRRLLLLTQGSPLYSPFVWISSQPLFTHPAASIGPC